MATKFEIDRTFVPPTKTVRAESDLVRKMNQLEIGVGCVAYVVDSTDGAAKPSLKNQYSRVAPAKWAERSKTFRVLIHPDQSGINQETQTRFAIVRVEFEEYTPRKRKNAEAVTE